MLEIYLIAGLGTCVKYGYQTCTNQIGQYGAEAEYKLKRRHYIDLRVLHISDPSTNKDNGMNTVTINYKYKLPL